LVFPSSVCDGNGIGWEIFDGRGIRSCKRNTKTASAVMSRKERKGKEERRI